MKPERKILIVDDSRYTIQVLRDILEDEYSLETAKSGEECLEKAFIFKPDIILLDIIMPGIDGYETCKRLRMNSALEHTKIIMVSSKVEDEDRLKGYEIGADDYITKPYNKDELREKVRVFTQLVTAKTEEKNIKKEGLKIVKNMIVTYNHEMNQPLTAIKGHIDMLILKADESDEAYDSLKIIQEQVDRVMDILDKITALASAKKINKKEYIKGSTMINLNTDEQP